MRYGSAPRLKKDLVTLGFPMPFNVTWTFRDLPIYSYDILTAIVVPVICALLFLFFKYTVPGKGIRAAASNRSGS